MIKILPHREDFHILYSASIIYAINIKKLQKKKTAYMREAISDLLSGFTRLALRSCTFSRYLPVVSAHLPLRDHSLAHSHAKFHSLEKSETTSICHLLNALSLLKQS